LSGSQLIILKAGYHQSQSHPELVRTAWESCVASDHFQTVLEAHHPKAQFLI
jgi:hypothetical protein